MTEANEYGWVEPQGWTWLFLKPKENNEDSPYELVVMGTKYGGRAEALTAMVLDATRGQTHFIAFMR